MKIIYFMRRRGGRATSDQLSEFCGLDDGQLRVTMNHLVRAKVVSVIG
jgi:hypothetical protein